MSTRCNIHFCYDGRVEANIYRHSDGYPDGVLPDLERFFTAVEEQTGGDTRFGDPSYLAAKFVVWQAGEFAWDYKLVDGKYEKVKGQPLNFLSLGVMSRDAGDAEYVYDVECHGLGNDGRPVVTHRKTERY